MADRVGQQFGDYRLTQNLGSGGFADVYLGDHIYLGTPAAIKILKGAFAQKDIDLFLAEAKTIVSLEHPHIVRIITFSVAEINAWHIPFLVLEYAAHGTLRQRHPKGVPLSLETIMPYVRQITDALQYAHDKKFIHRDIKPENMLLGRHDQVLLSDFGIALTTPQSGTLTTQEMAGTVAYMAPEQIKGHPRAASDQYSLAVVVYEWLCGERPFLGPPWEVINKHFYADPPPLHEKVPTISPAVEQVVLKALAKESQQRFPTVHEFATALEHASKESPIFPATGPVNRPITAQAANTPPTQIGGPVNRAPSQPSPIAPAEREASSPPTQVAGPVNQAAPQSASLPPTDRAIPPPYIANTVNQAAPQQFAADPPTQIAGQLNQAPVRPPSPASQQSSPQPFIPLEPIRDTSLPANDYATIQAPLPVKPSAQPAGSGSVSPTTERKKSPTVSRATLLVGLVILVVVVGAGFLLIPLLTRGTTTTPSTTATTATNPAALVTSNGTMFGIDLQRTHFDSNEHKLTPANVAGLTQEWTSATGGIVDASPTVANGKVYVASDDGTVYAFKTSCGHPFCTPVWATPTPSHNKIRSSPAVAKGIVYIGSYDHNLYAFNATTGKLLWAAPTGEVVRSSPAVANGIVYVGSNDRNLYAFNATTGKLLWMAPTEGVIDFSSPAVSNGTVYIGSEDQNLYAFNAMTGKLLWMAATGGIIGFSSPAVSNGTVYTGSEDHKLYAINAATGKILWTAQAGNSFNSSPAVANGMVYIGSDDNQLYAFNASGCGGNTSCNAIWRAPTGNVVRSSPTIANGVVYVGSDDGRMYALDAHTGSKLWSFSTGNANHIFSSPAVVDGVLYFGSTDHDLHAFHLNGATP